jgi:hypothetical protein
MTPAQVRPAASSIVGLPIDLPPKITVEAARWLWRPGVRAHLRGILQAAKSEPTSILTGKPVQSAPKRRRTEPKREPLSETKARARELLHKQLARGARPGAQIEAAVQAAEIPERVLIAAADALRVRTRKGQ